MSESALRFAARHVILGPLTLAGVGRRRLVRMLVVRGAARGLWFELDLLKGGENAYWTGRYEAPILCRLARVCRPGWTFWDIGASIGFYTVFLARAVGPAGRVIAFEPHPDNLNARKGTWN
jgi:hypothetical protein